jgi:hypothetical protein
MTQIASFIICIHYTYIHIRNKYNDIIRDYGFINKTMSNTIFARRVMDDIIVIMCHLSEHDLSTFELIKKSREPNIFYYLYNDLYFKNMYLRHTMCSKLGKQSLSARLERRLNILIYIIIKNVC